MAVQVGCGYSILLFILFAAPSGVNGITGRVQIQGHGHVMPAAAGDLRNKAAADSPNAMYMPSKPEIVAKQASTPEMPSQPEIVAEAGGEQTVLQAAVDEAAAVDAVMPSEEASWVASQKQRKSSNLRSKLDSKAKYPALVDSIVKAHIAETKEQHALSTSSITGVNLYSAEATSGMQWTWTEDLAVIAVLVLLVIWCTYTSSENVHREGSDANRIEANFVVQEESPLSTPRSSTSGVFTAFCRMLAFKPGLTTLFFVVSVISTCILARHYTALKHQPLKSTVMDTELKDVNEKAQHDFHSSPQDSTSAVLMIWNQNGRPMDFGDHSDYHSTLVELDSRLKVLKSKDSRCSSMDWVAYDKTTMPAYARPDFLSTNLDAAVVYVSLNNQGLSAGFGMKIPCFVEVQRYIVNINEKFGLRVEMVSENAVIDASLDAAADQTMRHIVLSGPLMLLLLMLGIGSPLRAVVPFIVLGTSLLGMMAAMVLLKWAWPALNFSGPDSTAKFVMLALSFDYALFFWTRFGNERRHRPQEHVSKAIFTTCQTSGYVVMLSMVVLCVANFLSCFYPNHNSLGFIGFSLQFIFGCTFCAIYSLMLPAILISHFPSYLDETGSQISCSDWIAANITVRPWWMRSLSDYITRKPWVYVVPLFIFICMTPCILTLRGIKLSYDEMSFYASKSTPEYASNSLYESEFDQNKNNPVYLFLQAIPVDGSAPPAVVPGGELSLVTKSSEFGRLSCKFVDFVMDQTRGQAHEIHPWDVSAIWWNPLEGKCVEPGGKDFVDLKGGQCLTTGPCVSFDGRDQTMLIYKNAAADYSADMVEFFWDKILPHTKWEFTGDDDKQYRFKATVTTHIAEQMLLEQADENAMPWIMMFTVIGVCGVVSYSFGSAFLLVKLVFTVFIPILAEYGALIGIYQYGWLECIGIHKNGIPWPFAFTTMPLLFALAIDYDVFLFARVFELRQDGYDNRSAVRIGLEETGPTITLAGTLMCTAFFFAFMVDLPVVSMAGLFYFLGVAIDTYIVRLFIAPASLCMFEKLNYWPTVMPIATKDYEDYDRIIENRQALCPGADSDGLPLAADSVYETQHPHLSARRRQAAQVPESPKPAAAG